MRLSFPQTIEYLLNLLSEPVNIYRTNIIRHGLSPKWRRLYISLRAEQETIKHIVAYKSHLGWNRRLERTLSAIHLTQAGTGDQNAHCLLYISLRME